MLATIEMPREDTVGLRIEGEITDFRTTAIIFHRKPGF